jgi:hypothetical protein
MARFRQGYFTPKNPHKYVGDPNKIRYMSSWELELHTFFDGNTNVLRWASEEIAIPYIKPTDGKIHKYYPDYWVEYVNSKGEIVQELIECKPKDQTKTPRSNRKHVLYEQLTYAINTAKWQAAQEWCRQRNITFRIVTEKSIFK